MSQKFFADELINFTAGTVASLTTSTFAPTNQARATTAIVTNVGNQIVLTRYTSDPDTATTPDTAVPLVTTAGFNQWVIEGYDNIVNAKFLVTSGSDGAVLVQYAR